MHRSVVVNPDIDETRGFLRSVAFSSLSFSAVANLLIDRHGMLPSLALVRIPSRGLLGTPQGIVRCDAREFNLSEGAFACRGRKK